jgi:prophage tail gpP-like protein
MTLDYQASGVIITDLGEGGPTKPLEPPSIAIRFEAQNRETRNVLEYSIDSAYMTSTDAFSFTLYEPDLSLIRNLELQPVSVYINDNLQVRGRVEITEIGQGPGLALKCEGRDYIADLVECNIDPAVGISENMTLEQVVKLAARPVGIGAVSFDPRPWRNKRTGVDIQSTLGARKFQNAPLKDYKPNPGEGIYQFIARICARFGCTLQPTMERNSVLLGAPDYVQDVAYSVSRSIDNPKSAQNNVINAKARRDYTKFPTVVLVTGKAGGAGAARQTVSATSYKVGTVEALSYRLLESMGMKGKVDTKADAATAKTPTEATSVPRNIEETILALVPEGVTIIPERLPPTVKYLPTDALYRLFYMRDNLGKDLDQVMNVAARNAAERLKDCLQYEVTFRGHKDPATGRTFAVDTIIDVSDEICDVNERLWVEHVRFGYEPNNGPTTTLTCWRPGSFGIGADK